MRWRQKLKRVIRSIPEKVPTNEIVTTVIHYLSQRKKYEGSLHGNRENAKQKNISEPSNR